MGRGARYDAIPFPPAARAPAFWSCQNGSTTCSAAGERLQRETTRLYGTPLERRASPSTWLINATTSRFSVEG